MSYESIIRPADTKQLEENWNENMTLKGTRQEKDYQPVCKLFLPWTSGTWLLTEKEPLTSLCFGLCDLGMGTPELGYVDLEELYSVRGPGGLRVEQDRHWKPSKTLSEYAAAATREGFIQA